MGQSWHRSPSKSPFRRGVPQIESVWAFRCTLSKTLPQFWMLGTGLANRPFSMSFEQTNSSQVGDHVLLREASGQKPAAGKTGPQQLTSPQTPITPAKDRLFQRSDSNEIDPTATDCAARSSHSSPAGPRASSPTPQTANRSSHQSGKEMEP